MSIIGKWDVEWMLNCFPDPNLEPITRVAILAEGGTVEVVDRFDGDADFNFHSETEGADVSAIVTLEDNNTRLIGQHQATVKGKAGVYYISGVALPNGQISAWLSFDSGSQDSGGQWGGPPK